jgi:Tol biopolymer transport system component
MADLRDRFAALDRVQVPDVWQRVGDLGHRAPGEERPPIATIGPRPPSEQRSPIATRVLIGVVALLIAGAGITLTVSSLGRSSSPSYSPTPPADAIVFDKASNDSLGARIEIAYVPARGGEVVPLTTAGKAGMVAAEPRWSPNGSQIAFVMGLRGQLTAHAGDGAIYVMNADGTGLRRLTGGPASSPAWSPDGARIVFVENQGQELVIMHADGSNQQVIARARGYYQGPAWSPDGRRIVYQSTPVVDSESTAIFTIRPDGTGERQLTDGSASEGFPAWSPDGSRIAYSAGEQLWIMDVDGSDPHQVTHCRLPCVADFAPAWAPDGGHLVFIRQEEGGAARRLYVVELAAAP